MLLAFVRLYRVTDSCKYVNSCIVPGLGARFAGRRPPRRLDNWHVSVWRKRTLIFVAERGHDASRASTDERRRGPSGRGLPRDGQLRAQQLSAPVDPRRNPAAGARSGGGIGLHAARRRAGAACRRVKARAVHQHRHPVRHQPRHPDRHPRVGGGGERPIAGVVAAARSPRPCRYPRASGAGLRNHAGPAGRRPARAAGAGSYSERRDRRRWRRPPGRPRRGPPDSSSRYARTPAGRLPHHDRPSADDVRWATAGRGAGDVRRAGFGSASGCRTPGARQHLDRRAGSGAP